MYHLRRKLSQNFLHNRELVKKLVRRSSVGKNDLLLEIGPGKGIITEQLLDIAHHVIAVEIDTRWYTYLHDKFGAVQNLTLHNQDFLTFSLPTLPYKVFANIPFAIEGKIIRKLINEKKSPEDCYLVMRKEFAYRLAAVFKENQFSIMHKPWFSFSLFHHFQSSDFLPKPDVHVAMLRFTKRSEPLLLLKEKEQYQRFIQVGFLHGEPVIKTLKKRYGHKRTYRIFHELDLRKERKPGELSLQQWIMLYKLFE